VILVLTCAVAPGGPPPDLLPLGTTLADYFQPGSQPSSEVIYDSFVASGNCRVCHAQDNGTPLAVHGPWQGSMMAQAARDPLFHAALAVANQDAAFSGDLCIRCHSPGGWISGRSEPTDASALTSADRDGVSCSVCHRMVDPVFRPGISPAIDASILKAIQPLPLHPGGGNYVLDPEDRRRGPYVTVTSPGHVWLHDPFLRSAELCATCHDVSNPVYERHADGTYGPAGFGQPHPTGDKHDMFPLERTYSEWLHSDFARFGVETNGRFGGERSFVRTCQDCHMPRQAGKGCAFGGVRDDLASHDFAGGNTWVQDMISNLYPNDGINPENLNAGKERSRSMLERACTLELRQRGNLLTVRIFNETGHKLPTGYPEGRRMWIHAAFFSEDADLLAEHGRYDAQEAILDEHSTRVYEVHLGLDEAASALSGRPAGKGFHFVLNNRVLKDNRIPPRGFDSRGYREALAMPVGADYADGQHWDDTTFRIPIEAASARIGIYYQTASREFITFLRDQNRTNQWGDVLFDQWEQTGKSAPVRMTSQTHRVAPFADGDADDDEIITLIDYGVQLGCLFGPDLVVNSDDCESFDFDADSDVDLADFASLQAYFGE
jgi:hypothetical protein